MGNIEEKMDKLQLELEHLELKLHRKIMEKTNEKELSSPHTN